MFSGGLYLQTHQVTKGGVQAILLADAASPVCGKLSLACGSRFQRGSTQKQTRALPSLPAENTN